MFLTAHIFVVFAAMSWLFHFLGGKAAAFNRRDQHHQSVENSKFVVCTPITFLEHYNLNN